MCINSYRIEKTLTIILYAKIVELWNFLLT